MHNRPLRIVNGLSIRMDEVDIVMLASTLTEHNFVHNQAEVRSVSATHSLTIVTAFSLPR